MKRFVFACCLALSFAFCAVLGFRGAVYAAPSAYIPGMVYLEPYATLVINLTDLSSSEVSESSAFSSGAAVCGDAVYIASQYGIVFKINTVTKAVTYYYTNPWARNFSVACDLQANRVYASARDDNSPPNQYLEVIDMQQNEWGGEEVNLGVASGDCDPTGIDVIPGTGVFMGNGCGRIACYYSNTHTLYWTSIGTGALGDVVAHPSGTWVYTTFTPNPSSANGSVKRIDPSDCSVAETQAVTRPTGWAYSKPYGIAFNHTIKSSNYTAYVTDSANSIIRHMTINASTGAIGATASAFNYPAWGASVPMGIAVSPDDSSLWVCLQNGGTGNGEADGIYLPTGQTKGYPTARPPICHGKFIAP